MSNSFSVTHSTEVQIKLKEEAFTDEFHKQFQETIASEFEYLWQHAEHISQMFARELISPVRWADEFVEGYGRLGDFVESLSISNVSTEAF